MIRRKEPIKKEKAKAGEKDEAEEKEEDEEKEKEKARDKATMEAVPGTLPKAVGSAPGIWLLSHRLNFVKILFRAIAS